LAAARDPAGAHTKIVEKGPAASGGGIAAGLSHSKDSANNGFEYGWFPSQPLNKLFGLPNLSRCCQLAIARFGLSTAVALTANPFLDWQAAAWLPIAVDRSIWYPPSGKLPEVVQ
jgi:hypothetical protein